MPDTALDTPIVSAPPEGHAPEGLGTRPAPRPKAPARAKPRAAGVESRVKPSAAPKQAAAPSEPSEAADTVRPPPTEAPDTVLDTPTVARAAVADSEPPPAIDPMAAGATEPNVELPPELPAEPTMPSVTLPEKPADPTATRPRSAAFEPSVVVDPSIGAPTPSAPVAPKRPDAGAVTELTVLPEARSGPKSKSTALLAVLGVLAALVLVGLGVGAYFWLGGSPAEPEPIAAPPSAPERSVEAPVADDPAQTEVAEAEATEAEATEAETAEAETAEAEATEVDPTPPAAGSAVTPREELEGYELERPRLSRRARRMSGAQRRRYAQRYRRVAIRHYRNEAYAEAEESYLRGLQYVPRDAAAFEGLARAIAQQSRFAEALAWAQEAIDRNPDSPTAHRVLGDVWRQAGHVDEARRAYRRGLAHNPGDRWLRQRLRDL